MIINKHKTCPKHVYRQFTGSKMKYHRGNAQKVEKFSPKQPNVLMAKNNHNKNKKKAI